MTTTMTQVGVLQSVQIGTPHYYGTKDAENEMERRWKTSFFRTPTTQSLWLFKTHLEGNEQADKKNHGSLNQAVLLYAASNYRLWQEEIGRLEMSAGGFGENFTIEGMSEETACVGDIYAIGEAEIQVTGPRYPCTKIEKRWNMPGLTARVAEMGRTGWYCRVLQEGRIDTGLPVMLIERPYPRWTMALINSFANGKNKDVELAQELAACPLLEEWWGNLIVKRAKSRKKS